MYKKYNYEAILAVNTKEVIGRENRLIWNIPEDLKYFRELTKNNIVIMGRKTQDSIPNNQLPNRINIVLTRNPEKYEEEINLTESSICYTNELKLEKIIEDIKRQYPEKKIFVIGGAEVYKKFIPKYERIHITKVYNQEEGDVYNPITEAELKKHNFRLIEESKIKKSRNGKQEYKHLTYEKL